MQGKVGETMKISVGESRGSSACAVGGNGNLRVATLFWSRLEPTYLSFIYTSFLQM